VIKRIKKIEGVGRFLNVGHTELGHVTLIYGPNCYGKSTLAEIFHSIGNNAPEVLLKRQSIVKNSRNISQEICFSVKNEKEQKEYEMSFSNEKWNIDNFNYSIEVFDSRFIEENVFTGLTISRSNKENLTNLLIGEKSVEIGKQIDSLKKSLYEIIKEINELANSLKIKLGILDLGINLEDFILIKNSENILKKELSLNEEDKLVISHGGLNPNRGLENLIKVFKYTPRNIKLVMMGNGILKQKLEQMIAELGLKEKVYIIDEKPIGVYYRYVASADLGIDIRDVENLNYKLALPIRIVDDIICGIPVAVPWDMEVAKLINNFGLGIVFKSRVSIDIAKDIYSFLNDNSSYDSIVKNVDVFRKTEFSLSNQVKIMSNFLDCIL